MKLANLVYEAVKDSIEFPSGFNKEGFIRGDYDTDRDYNSQISFAFNYLNLALARLVSGRKTKLKLVSKLTDNVGFFAFNESANGEGQVISIVDGLGVDYKRVNFKRFSNGFATEVANTYVVVEYRPYIPHFDLGSIRKEALDEDNHLTYEEVDINLEDYGITDEMCAYVKEYIKGGLTEYLSPDLSQKHTQMAENYFATLKTQHTDFPQREIENRFNPLEVL